MAETGAGFWGYLRRWWKAAFAPAWDAFGWIGILVGAAVWATNKYWPTQFRAIADFFRVPPESAVNDLVWQIPMAAGGVVLLYRLVRAPYEMHREAQQRIDRLHRTDFDVGVTHGGYYLIEPDQDQHVTMPGIWLVYYGIVLTNKTDKQLPLELWLHVGMNAQGTWRYGEVCASTYPKWAADDEHVEHAEPFDRVVNLPALSSQAGFCITRLTESGVLGMAGVSSLKELAETRPFWLEIKNNLTGRSISHAINHLAKRIDAGLVRRP